MVETSVAAPRARSIIGLDLIRFGAAVAVTVYHLAWRVWEAPITTGVDIVRGLVRYDGWTFSSGGWIGVEVFFVISGLVIAFSAETATPWKFAKSRIVRIYPGAWLCASLSAVAIMILVKPPLGELAGQWFRSMVIYPPGDWLTGVYWTLAVEIAFYATVLAFLLLGAFDRISWLFAGLSVWSFAYLAYLAFIHFARVRVDLPAFVPNVLLLKHGCFFAVGGYLWLWSRKRITPVHWAFAVLAVVACGVEIAAKFDGHAEGAAGALVWLAVVGLMALSIAYNRYLSSPTVARLSRSLGLATYPLYLIHTTVGFLIIRFVPLPDVGHRILLGCAASIAAAFVVSLWLEPVGQRLLSRALDRLAGDRPEPQIKAA